MYSRENRIASNKINTLKSKRFLNSENSLIGQLTRNKMIDDRFVNCINNLSLEDLIAIKLEATALALGGRFYGLPVVSSLTLLVGEAIFRASLSLTRRPVEAAAMLGVTRKTFYNMRNKYGRGAILDKLR